MKFLLGVIFISVYFCCDTQIGYSLNSPVYTHFVYMWQHGSLFHLAVNMYSYLSLYVFLSKVISGIRLIIYGYFAGIIASFGSANSIVTVGASGMILGFIGIYLVLAVCGKLLKIKDGPRFILWMVIMGGITVFTSLLPGVNGLNHLIGFVTGGICGLFESIFFKK